MQEECKYDEWPITHLVVMGMILLLMFLEGLLIVSEYGALHVIVFIILWVASFPVIHYSACRKCMYYGKRCPVPGEGNLVHLLFEKSDSPAHFVDYIGVMLCYGMRLGYPLILLFFNDSLIKLTALILMLTVVLFFLIHSQIIGCPHCKKTKCPANPHR